MYSAGRMVGTTRRRARSFVAAPTHRTIGGLAKWEVFVPSWECPVCGNVVERDTALRLHWSARAHVQHHMDTAALQLCAVMTGYCTCHLFGTKSKFKIDPDDGLPELNVYDEAFLAELAIRWKEIK